MDRTKEPDEGIPRLPVAYSQGYVYISVIQGTEADSDSVKDSGADVKSETSNEQPNAIAPLGPPLAAVALAALIGPFIGGAAFVLLQNV